MTSSDRKKVAPRRRALVALSVFRTASGKENMANEHTDKLVQKYTPFSSTENMLEGLRRTQHPPLFDLSEGDPRQQVVLAQFIKAKTGIVSNLVNQPTNGSLWKAIKLCGLTSLDHKRYMAKIKARNIT